MIESSQPARWRFWVAIVTKRLDAEVSILKRGNLRRQRREDPGALRGEGTSPYYVANNFSTVAHPEIIDALKRAAEALQVRFHLGWIFTTDALFQETPELIAQLTQQNVSSIDMVTSVFLTIAQVRKKKAAAILAVSDECLYGKFGFRDPLFFAAEEKIIAVAREALKYL